MNLPDVQTQNCPRQLNSPNKDLIVLADIIYGARSFVFFADKITGKAYIYENTGNVLMYIEDEEIELHELLYKAIKEQNIGWYWKANE
jgi:hypothetical protein